METQVRTPQLIFMQPQRLIVPLFQRPYVWNEENQWAPLWDDLARLAERLLKSQGRKSQPHFLGAVVLQQMPKQTGQMQERTVIDGQQRLTTLQVLLDALAGQLGLAGAVQPAMRIGALVRNAEPFCSGPDDRFKVWPTNRDRPAFNEVMGADKPLDYTKLTGRGERITGAHKFFSEQARDWLQAEGAEEVQKRAAAIETAARELLQIVVIDLTADENAQEIFETLNARGAQLTPADLIKNFIFQRLQEDGANVEVAYASYWREFETGFWETEISVGRLRYPRSSLFLNHWLVANTGEEVVAREVFDRFKRYSDAADLPMLELLKRLHAASGAYRQLVMAASSGRGPVERLGLFAYRTSVLESEVVKPFILSLLDPEQPTVPDDQVLKALDVVESWMVRRMLVRATTKGYNQVIAELIGLLRKSDRTKAGEVVEQFFVKQRSASRYWPDNAELEQELTSMQAYRRLGRGRLRMVLEAIEDDLRGWVGAKKGLGGERVTRGKFAIEHIMPRKWQANWPLMEGGRDTERDRLIHNLGNLTLLTDKLNSKVSNGPWMGDGGKRQALEGHDVLMLNRELLKDKPDVWSEDGIRLRADRLIHLIEEIWAVPANYKSEFAPDSKPQPGRSIDLNDLITAGMLQVGMPLFPRRNKYSHLTATLLSDGKIEIGGRSFDSPTDAATAVAERRTNGWWFFLTDQASKCSLSSIRQEYIEAMAMHTDEEDEDEDEDET
jgi:hypothetical protein